jgi:hypothetical protein
MAERDVSALDWWMFGGYTISALALWVLSPVLYIWTLYLAYVTSFPALLLSLFIPVGPQLFYVLMFWGANDPLMKLYMILCGVWLAALVVRLVVRFWIAKTGEWGELPPLGS